jgi:hypothetical protein
MGNFVMAYSGNGNGVRCAGIRQWILTLANNQAGKTNLEML